jgi:hypothetical protein
MTAELPPDMPSFEVVSDDELTLAENLGRMAFEAEYQDRVNRFRADVVQLFRGQGYDDVNMSWMVFDIQDEAEGNVIEGPRTDLLITALIAPSPKGPMLHVRMMKNELYRVETGHDCVVTDITVDNDGDALYFIDSFPIREDLPTRKIGGEELQVMNVLPMFLMHEGNVAFITSGENRPEFGNYTPVVDVNIYPDADVSIAGEEVFPFGLFDCMEDRSHALDVAIELLGQVKGTTPSYTSRELEA